MTLLLGRIWIPLVTVIYVAFAAVQSRAGAPLAYWVILASPVLFWVWRATATTEGPDRSTENSALLATRSACAGALLWLAARSGPAGHAAFDAVANFATGVCTISALIALARISAPPGLLKAPKLSLSLDGAIFAGFLWAVATSLPAIRALVRDSALKLDPVAIDYATVTASLSSILILLVISARFRWLRRLELGVGDRASGSVVLSAVAVLLAVPLALLNVSAPDRLVPELLVLLSLGQCWIAVTRQPARVMRWLRASIALLAIGAPVSLLAYAMTERYPNSTGWLIIALALASAATGMLVRTIARPLEPEQARWITAIEDATLSALEPDPNDALRLSLVAMERLSPHSQSRTELWCIDPPGVKHVDIGGQLHERLADLPELLPQLAATEPALTLRLEVLKAVEVRRPEVRPLVAWFENQGTFSATLLQSESGPVGALCVPSAGRKSPLTLEEGYALQRLGARLGAIMSVSAAQARSHRRELTATRERQELEAQLHALTAFTEAQQAGYSKVVESWARPIRDFTYSPTSRLALEQVERTARSHAHLAIVSPIGTDQRAWAAAAHLASARKAGPFFVVNGESDLELVRSYLAIPSGVRPSIRATIAVLEPLALDLQTQQKLLGLINESAESPDEIGVILSVHRAIDDLAEQQLVDSSLITHFRPSKCVIPALSERGEDLRALILDKAARLGVNLRGRPSAPDNAVLADLLNYSWPGNETELQSVMELLVKYSKEELIRIDDLDAIGHLPIANQQGIEDTGPLRVQHRPPQRRITKRSR